MLSTHFLRRWSQLRRTASLVVVSLALATLASCNSGPARVHQPSINASAAGAAAMDEYDTNGDGVVAGVELENAPGLKALLATADTNKDGGISAEEVTERIRVWQGTRKGIMPFSFLVTLNGKPLEGASVTLEPESFLGDEIKAARGETDYFGSSSGSIPVADRPNPSSPGGMQLGLYKVRISKLHNGRETIPNKYNEHTILGQEVSPDVPEIVNRRVRYSLESN